MSEWLHKTPKFLAASVLLLGTGLALSTLSFSRDSRQIIISRDRHCKDDQGTSHIGYIEAAHIDHNKKLPSYDNPDNGRALCTKHHIDDHRKNEGNNGLNRGQNRWAIRKITERLAGYLMHNPQFSD